MLLNELFGMQSVVPKMIDSIMSSINGEHKDKVDEVLKTIGLSVTDSKDKIKSKLRELGYDDERKLLRKYNDIREIKGKSRIKPSAVSAGDFE